MLLDRMVNAFESSVREKNLLSETDIEKMTYGLHVILGECTKLIILGVFFLIFDRFLEFILAFIILVSIRTHSGGLHFYTWTKCFLFSFTFFVLAILVLPRFTFLNQIGFFIFFVALSSIITAIYAPKTSKYRPLTKRKYILKSKFLALLFTFIWFTLLFIFFLDSTLFSIGIWIITLQNTQLLLSGGLKYEKN